MRLTADEIKLVSFILLALTLGAIVKHYRANARLQAAHAVASPTPRAVAAKR